MACAKDHSKVQEIMKKLPYDQGRRGRHKCAACAYEKGFQWGCELKENIDLEAILNSLENSQAKNQRHKSPHSAFAKGYYDGVNKFYSEK